MSAMVTTATITPSISLSTSTTALVSHSISQSCIDMWKLSLNFTVPWIFTSLLRRSAWLPYSTTWVACIICNCIWCLLQAAGTISTGTALFPQTSKSGRIWIAAWPVCLTWIRITHMFSTSSWPGSSGCEECMASQQCGWMHLQTYHQ